MTESFIEKQFPVSKISKESYKERKAVSGQTLTGLGKWWGRKPLILVRAAILGCLMPASDDPDKDKEIFLKILSMDEYGLLLRKDKKLSAKELYAVVCNNHVLKSKYKKYFIEGAGGKVTLEWSAPKAEIESEAFKTLGYDKQIALCKRPEQLENISEKSWKEINEHLGTDAHSLADLVGELSYKRYGRLVRVGDCFCGGGSIPFEAARMGCEAYGSDLNPVAAMLTWADINLCGASKAEITRINTFRQKVFDEVQEEIDKLGVETNEHGDRAVAYLYCEEAVCPDCGQRVPLAPSWVIGKRTKTVAKIVKNGNKYNFAVKMDASAFEMKKAESGTITKNGMCCPCCNKTTSISALRRDRIDENGSVVYGLRRWNKDEFEARDTDVFHERLYAIKYEKPDGTRYYRAPNARDIKNEEVVKRIVKDNLADWQDDGFVPSIAIEDGFNTNQLFRERGWQYWHQLFNARQLLLLSLFVQSVIKNAQTKQEYVAGILGINKIANWNSKLCIWNTLCEKNEQVFLNQALNTLFNYGARTLSSISQSWFYDIKQYKTNIDSMACLSDARSINHTYDYWVTDPPYADAVNYHELTEFFLAWDKALIPKAFPEWYTDSKRILAVRGDTSFSHTMIDIYKNLTDHMSDDGLQIVMFTHSDPAVWAQLALIMWKAGLTVTAAWNIATETESGGLKDGNYVKGTVLLVLRKQTSDEEAFLDEITADIKAEVKNQIGYMQALDSKEDPNFSDPDYVLAAYAASLKVLTGYGSIGEIDLDHELDLAIHNPAKSEVVKLIEKAKKIAYDCIIPSGFDPFIWKDLLPVEKFYIKGLEAEKCGDKRISTFQEYARGFGIKSYSSLLGSTKANEARLKTPVEIGLKNINEIPEFAGSTLSIVLQAIHISISEKENPRMGLSHLHQSIDDYWSKREMIMQLLNILVECRYNDNMPQWRDCGDMAENLYVLVDNDRI